MIDEQIYTDAAKLAEEIDNLCEGYSLVSIILALGMVVGVCEAEADEPDLADTMLVVMEQAAISMASRIEELSSSAH